MNVCRHGRIVIDIDIGYPFFLLGIADVSQRRRRCYVAEARESARVIC